MAVNGKVYLSASSRMACFLGGILLGGFSYLIFQSGPNGEELAVAIGLAGLGIAAVAKGFQGYNKF